MSQNTKYLILVYLTIITPLKTAITIENDRDEDEVVPLVYLINKTEKLRAVQTNLENIYKALDFCNKILVLSHQQNEIFEQNDISIIETELKLKKTFFDKCKESENFTFKNNEEKKFMEAYFDKWNYDSNLRVINSHVTDLKDILKHSNRIITEFINNSDQNNLYHYINKYAKAEIVLRKVVIVDNVFDPAERLKNKKRMELYIGQISILAIIKKIVMDVFKTDMLGDDKLKFIIDLIQVKESTTDYVWDLMSFDIKKMNYMFYFIMSAGRLKLPTPENYRSLDFLKENYEAMKNLIVPQSQTHQKIDNTKIFKKKYLAGFFNRVDQGYYNSVDISQDTSKFNNYNVFLDTTWVKLEDLDSKEKFTWTSHHAENEMEAIFKTRTLDIGNELDTIGEDVPDRYWRTRNHKKQFMVYYYSNCRSFNNGGILRI